VILVRRESFPKGLIKDMKSYGHMFPEKYTTWDAEVAKSCSHQSIIESEFDGLRFLLRSEIDGYLKQTAAEVPSNTIPLENQTFIPGVFGPMSMGNAVPSEGQKLPEAAAKDARHQGTPGSDLSYQNLVGI
jgi:hypothetical protein